MKGTITKLPCCSWATRHWQVAAHQSHMNRGQQDYSLRDSCFSPTQLWPPLSPPPLHGARCPVVWSGWPPMHALPPLIHWDWSPLPYRKMQGTRCGRAPGCNGCHLTKGAKTVVSKLYPTSYTTDERNVARMAPSIIAHGVVRRRIWRIKTLNL